MILTVYPSLFKDSQDPRRGAGAHLARAFKSIWQINALNSTGQHSPVHMRVSTLPVTTLQDATCSPQAHASAHWRCTIRGNLVGGGQQSLSCLRSPTAMEGWGSNHWPSVLSTNAAPRVPTWQSKWAHWVNGIGMASHCSGRDVCEPLRRQTWRVHGPKWMQWHLEGQWPMAEWRDHEN